MTDNAPTITREQRRQELEQTNFSTNQQGGALMQPRNGKELMDMANMMSGAGQMVRDFYRGNPGDCAALIMICQPYGMNPFMVSWKTYKASKGQDAPISFEGQLVNAMVNQSAPVKGRLKYHYEGEIEDGTRRCTVTGIDREDGSEITYTSPMLKDIKIKNSPLWKADPDQQLGYFSARSWARRHFPELLLGVYTREEIEEAPVRDITPKEGGFAAKAKAARPEPPAPEPEEPETIEDAEVLPPESDDQPAEDDQPTQHDGPDPDQTSFEYSEGRTAAENGMGLNDCPYEMGTQLWVDWAAGWNSVKDKA